MLEHPMQHLAKPTLIIALIGVVACEGREASETDHAMPAAPAVSWLGDNPTDFTSPGFAPGAKMVVLQGNPADTGGFVLRLSFPDGYAVPPHWHPTTETVTVLDGTFVIGMGEKADRAQAKAIAAGGVGVAPAKMPHFAWAQGQTVVQVHGAGPFQLNLVAQKP